MKSWHQHPLVVSLLLLAVVAVWGTVWWRVQIPLEDVPEPRPLQSVASELGASNHLLPFIDIVRDPFSSPAHIVPHEALEEAVQAPAPSPPQPNTRLMLQGVVGQTAILMDAAGVPFVVRPGDALSGGTVVAVEPDRVTIESGGEPVVLTLN